ncbi:MAG TPA: hypothetical protein VMY42_22620 [Thermoguttaceae bacterium]|nr:hypothetical protein [Thermoguttaceae bacterium]
MARPARQTVDAPGHDSFLDIVANIVGILIILVMVVGVRVKNAPIVAAIVGESREDDSEFEKDATTERSLYGDVLKVENEVRAVEVETLVQKQQRDALAVTMAAVEQEIQSRRQRMDTEAQRDFDLRRNLSVAQVRLEQLDRQRVEVETTPAEPTVVESYPTPLSTTVDEREAHFQLRGGRVAFIPWEGLMNRVVDDIRLKGPTLFNSPEISGTLGPEGGFRIRYKRSRNDIFVELIPVARDLGETIDEALSDGSEFRRALARFHPERSAVTFWTYPDGFAEFRRLKEETFLQGFRTAARPLPHGLHISGSSRGSKSSAQ